MLTAHSFMQGADSKAVADAFNLELEDADLEAAREKGDFGAKASSLVLSGRIFHSACKTIHQVTHLIRDLNSLHKSSPGTKSLVFSQWYDLFLQPLSYTEAY